MPLDLTPQLQNVYNLGTPQKVDYTASSAASTNAIAAHAVLLVATTSCYIVFGSSPTATSAGILLPALTPMAVTCQPTDKVAAIRLSADGSLTATALN